MKKTNELLLLPELEKMITASITGRWAMLSGKRIGYCIVEQYKHVYKLLQQFEQQLKEPFVSSPFSVQFNSNSLRTMQKKNHWQLFYRQFSDFLFQKKKYYNQ